MSQKKNLRSVGAHFEERAAEYLSGLGYEILERNYRCRSGEIDLIGRDGRYLVFIEVKYRASLSAGDPAEAVHAGKQRRIVNTARYYLLTHGMGEDIPCRFDVVSMSGQEIRLIRDAFWAR